MLGESQAFSGVSRLREMSLIEPQWLWFTRYGRLSGCKWRSPRNGMLPRGMAPCQDGVAITPPRSSPFGLSMCVSPLNMGANRPQNERNHHPRIRYRRVNGGMGQREYGYAGKPIIQVHFGQTGLEIGAISMGPLSKHMRSSLLKGRRSNCGPAHAATQQTKE